MMKKKAKRLIIDADGFLYKLAAQLETEWHVGEGIGGLPEYVAAYLDPQELLQGFLAKVKEVNEKWAVGEPMICLTDSKHNFRTDIYPMYKSGRKHTRKPLGLKLVREHLAQLDNVYLRDGLEADDVVGILMTKDGKEGVLCWSEDKDLLTIPGYHIDHKTNAIIEITEEEADRNHLFQTVTGDTTDGYPGIPTVGAVTAKKWFDQKGWTWEAAEELAATKGMTRDALLVQARLARILRASDYDFKAKKVILWNPKT